MFEAAEIEQRVSKEDFEQAIEKLRVELLNAQFDLKDADFSVVILLDGDDRPACSQALKSMHEWMDQRHIEANAFVEPTDEERSRPLFWRYVRRLPRHGRMGVFLAGWTIRNIADRLQGDIDDGDYDRRLEHIRSIEESLVDDGTLILKYWFHLPRKELKRRLKQAKKKPQKLWWLAPEDEEIYERYDEVLPLAERLIRKTSSADAPWLIIGSQNQNYRNLTFATHLHERLTERLARSAEISATGPSSQAATERPALPTRSVLDEVDLSQSLKKSDYEKKLDKLQAKIRKLSFKAHDAGVASVLAFEGWDAAGKGGVIRRLTWPIDPRIFQVISVAAPTEEELAHHYLWRFILPLPAAGHLTIFDRTWYGRVLVERVESFAKVRDWRRAYSEINDFEEQLAESGVLLHKFWLHIDPDEQLRRFEAREDTPYKQHKITEEDYRNRERWDAYVEAVHEMVTRTSTAHAPWHLIPANDKRFARVEVLRTYARALRARL
jgi:polyphosphate:AMP phosphotransferase